VYASAGVAFVITSLMQFPAEKNAIASAFGLGISCSAIVVSERWIAPNREPAVMSATDADRVNRIERRT
jgi:hypothetical protein